MKFSIRAIALLWFWLGLSLLAQAAPAQEFMLDNGMKIIVKEDHRAPDRGAHDLVPGRLDGRVQRHHRRRACAGAHDVQGHQER